jgi:hypothetical protein
MAAPARNPLTPEPRRISIRLPRPLPIWLATIGLSLAAAVADAQDIAKDAPPPEQQVEIADPNVYRWVFGGNSDAIEAGKVLERLLRQKIAIVDRVCRLTDTQKQKLLLAGRGDIKRFIDGVEEIGTRMRHVKDDPDKVNALGQEAHALSFSFIVPGLPIGRLLFVKVLETTLTAEQLARYEPLRAVYRVGGLVQSRGPDEVALINLNGTAFADDGLAHVKGLTGLKSLLLSGTQVTDAGLAHLKGLTGLETLRLMNTQVTDTGLEHLKRLTKLKQLELSSTRVTDSGVAELKLALPGLTNSR